MKNYQKDIAEQIDSMPVKEARMKIASGDFGDIGSPKHAFASSWLSAKEENLKNINKAKNTSLGKIKIASLSKDIWQEIEKEYDVTKRSFGKKINFIQDQFKRKIIFRDVEQAFLLCNFGFNKPSVVLAGSIVEEMLRLYLENKGVEPERNSLHSYIRACEEQGLLGDAISKLADSIRQFRNIVYLERESSGRDTISKSLAKGAVSSVFTIANYFNT